MNPIRTNVSFYEVNNGFTEFYGKGKEISLPNGNQYAIIDNIKYRVLFDGINNQQLIKLTTQK